MPHLWVSTRSVKFQLIPAGFQKTPVFINVSECRRRDSNPHGTFAPRDFKSGTCYRENSFGARWCPSLPLQGFKTLAKSCCSSAVHGRPPYFRIIRSDSLTVNTPLTGFKQTMVGLMGEKVRKVGLRVFCEITDGIIKSLIVVHIRKKQLHTQARFSPEDIAMGLLMSRIVSSNPSPIVIKKGHQNDSKFTNPPSLRPATNQQSKFSTRNNPVFIRHDNISGLRKNQTSSRENFPDAS